jgi:hypothetical protein
MIVRVDEFKEWNANPGMRATGINGFGEWKENLQFGTHRWRGAHDEEVEQALAKEAERRGWWTGDILGSDVEYEEDRLFLGGQCIYRQGEWADSPNS